MRITRDSRGVAISLDILLALIPLTIMLGIVAADMDNIMYQMEDAIFRSSTERVAADTVDTLLKTSGNPYNWEDTFSGSNSGVIGLAEYDEFTHKPYPYVVSPGKMGAVSSTPALVTNLTGSKYGYFIKISNVNTKSTVITAGNAGGVNTAAKEIVRVDRNINYGKLKVLSKIEDVVRYTSTPRDYTNPPQPFYTSSASLVAYDYYVLVINRDITSARVVINGESIVDPNDFKKGISPIVKLIDPQFLQNETDMQSNTVILQQVASKPGCELDMYIIRAPKGTPESEITLNNTKAQKCYFEFFMWPIE